MKSLHYLSLFFLLGNEVSSVAALPAGGAATEKLADTASNFARIPVNNKRDDNPLVALGEELSAIQPITDLPHIPLGSRDESHASRIAMVKKRATDTLGSVVNLDETVPLNAYKKIGTKDVGGPENVSGHPVPSELVELLIRNGHLGSNVATKDKRTTFNAETQLINVTGEHAWIAPDFANGDKRGPCPGMNTLANHGFVPRNGVASIAEVIVAANDVFGMGIDISTFLAVYGTVLSGNPLSLNPGFSIGDESDESQNLLGNLGGLLGTPRGLDGTHNTFEVDGSGTRGDLYDPIGNNYDLNMSYFMDMYNLQKDAEEPNYSVDVIIEHSLNRFDQAVAFNPYYYYGPFTGMVLRNGASFFAARLFVNASEEHPEGIIGKETLKSFFGVTGPEENMTYTAGHERIPDNWYRRSDDYDVAGVALDLANMATKYPRVLGIGGNTNGVNTYAGIDLNNITGGILNAEGLLEGNNLLCFAFQFLKEASPNSLSSLYETLATPLGMLVDVIESTVSSLDCPAFGDLTYKGTDLFEYINTTYPGAVKSGSAL